MIQTFKMNFEDIIIQPYDWVVHDDSGDDGKLRIHCWGLDRQSKANLVVIPNFPAYCMVELPLFLRGKPFTWTKESADIMAEEIRKQLKYSAFHKYNFIMRKKLYYFRNRKFPMLQLIFKNVKMMRRCAKILEDPIQTEMWGYVKCNVWEHWIAPERKMITARDIKYAQWLKIRCCRVEDPDAKVSKLSNEFIASWDSIVGIPSDMTETWNTSPGILAFDIECYSHNHRAMPDKYDARHVAYMISAIYQRWGKPEERLRYGIIIGECPDVDTEELPNCKIIRVKDEHEMMIAFAQIVEETDPEILTGYNILSFDYPYLDHRLKRNLNDWPKMGRLLEEPTYIHPIRWKSGAYGYQDLGNLIMEGRINIDMLPVVKRDHKLDRYNLDTVCRKFLGDKTKHDVKPAEMFCIYEELTESTKLIKSNPEDLSIQARHEAALADMKRVMAYCIVDSELVLDLMEVMNVWVSSLELSSILGITIEQISTRGQQIRCLSQLYDLAAKKGYVVDQRENLNYGFSGGHVFTPSPGLYDNIICLDFSSLYPSIIRAWNLCYTTLIPPELENLIPDEDCNIIEFDQEEEVQKPKIMNDEGEEMEFNYDDLDEEDEEEKPKGRKKKKVETVIRHYKFKFYKHQEGLLPELERRLVTERKEVRNKMEGVKDPIVKAVLNARQLALKMSANSFFGFLGAQTNKLRLPEGAMSITAKGRQSTNMVAQVLAEKYGAKVVYGDTDSVMIDMGEHITSSDQCQYWGERLSHEISGVFKGQKKPYGEDGVYEEDAPGLFPPPMAMEFEKAMRIICVAKKKYAYLPIGKDGKFKKDPKTGDYIVMEKGIVLARRDNCVFLRESYRQILMNMLFDGDYMSSYNMLYKSIQDLLNDRVPIEKLVIVKQLGGNYKSDNYFLKVFADNLKRLGKQISPGDRLNYLIVENGKTKLGDKLMLYEDFMEEDNSYKIDKPGYLKRVIGNPIDQIFQVTYPKEIEQMKGIYFQPTKRHKQTGMDTPTILFKLLIERNLSIEDFYNNFVKAYDEIFDEDLIEFEI